MGVLLAGDSTAPRDWTQQRSTLVPRAPHPELPSLSVLRP